MPNLIGQTLLNQFRVDAFIASGGMGAVYKVWDLKRNVALAMKTLHSDLADDPTVLKRFKREANALRKLTHPNIVQFYGLFQTDDISFLLEQYVDGPTLAQIIKARKGKPFPIKEALIYLKAVCAALGYAHANGVVHCDVKPGNIIVDSGGNVYLTDFGIARHADSTTTTLAGIGTAAYMAPEQIRSEPVTPATDIYALGIILFEMLTGQRPFRSDGSGTSGRGATASELVRAAQLTQLPPDPCTINPLIPDSIAQAILQALSKDPLSRFHDIQDLFQALLNGAGMSASMIVDRVIITEDIAELFGQEQSHKSPSYDREKRPPPPTNRKTAVLWMVGAGIVVIAMIGGFNLFNRNRPVPIATDANSASPIETESIVEVVPENTVTPVIIPSKTPTLTSTQTLTPSPTIAPTSTMVPIYFWRNDSNQGGLKTEKFTTLAVDEDGNSHILYFSEHNDTLSYIRTDPNGQWGQPTILKSGSGEGWFASVDLDTANNLFFAYHSGRVRDSVHPVWFVDYAQNQWYKVSGSDVRTDCDISMVLGKNNQPFISFQEKTTQKLKIATFTTSGGWKLEVIADTNTCYTFPIAINKDNGELHLSFQGQDGGLWYTAKINNNWLPPIEIDQDRGAGIFSAIAVDGLGNPHIAYCDPDIPALKYASNDGGQWRTFLIESSVCSQIDYGISPSIVASKDGSFVHISYYDDLNKDLKYALIHNGSLQSIQLIDSTGDVGKWNSITLGPDDIPRISYQDDSNQSLKLAWASINPSANLNP